MGTARTKCLSVYATNAQLNAGLTEPLRQCTRRCDCWTVPVLATLLRTVVGSPRITQQFQVIGDRSDPQEIGSEILVHRLIRDIQATSCFR